jgi:hypothetical protein
MARYVPILGELFPGREVELWWESFDAWLESHAEHEVTLTDRILHMGTVYRCGCGAVYVLL